MARQVHPTSPPTVEYWFAPMGTSLLNPMGKLIEWANAHFTQMTENRRHFDGARQTPALIEAAAERPA